MSLAKHKPKGHSVGLGGIELTTPIALEKRFLELVPKLPCKEKVEIFARKITPK
jgi:hypothetical protein